MKAFGTIKNGKLILNNERRFNDNLNIFEGEEIEIRIKVRANNLYYLKEVENKFEEKII